MLYQPGMDRDTAIGCFAFRFPGLIIIPSLLYVEIINAHVIPNVCFYTNIGNLIKTHS